jgi:hypothetical protein
MPEALAILLVLGIGFLLTYGATRATASVQNGPRFLRWMVVVFVTYLALISLPVVFGF